MKKLLVGKVVEMPQAGDFKIVNWLFFIPDDSQLYSGNGSCYITSDGHIIAVFNSEFSIIRFEETVSEFEKNTE